MTPTTGVEPDAADPHRVHGQATISVAPDQAQFDIGVVTPRRTLPKRRLI